MVEGQLNDLLLEHLLEVYSFTERQRRDMSSVAPASLSNRAISGASALRCAS